jgi:hypothetical protein
MLVIQQEADDLRDSRTIAATIACRARYSSASGRSRRISGPEGDLRARARLNDMKVAPARADMAASNAATSEMTRTPASAATIAPKPVPARDKRGTRIDAANRRPTITPIAFGAEVGGFC